MRYTKTLAAVAATGAIGLAAMPVLAQEDAGSATDETTDQSTDESGTTEDSSRDQDRAAEHEARRAQELDELAAALAEELGIDQDQVSAALTTVMEERQAARQAERETARQERLDAAVEDGTLTQEQADALAELGDVGVFRGRGGPFGEGGDHHDAGPRGPGGPGGPGGPMGDVDPDAMTPGDEATPGA